MDAILGSVFAIQEYGRHQGLEFIEQHNKLKFGTIVHEDKEWGFFYFKKGMESCKDLLLRSFVLTFIKTINKPRGASGLPMVRVSRRKQGMLAGGVSARWSHPLSRQLLTSKFRGLAGEVEVVAAVEPAVALQHVAEEASPSQSSSSWASPQRVFAA